MSSTKFKIILSTDTIFEVAEQAAYYRDRADGALAERWRASVNETIRSLRTLPERGSLLEVPERAARDLRRVPIQGFPQHLLFYRVDLVLRSVYILTVTHAAQDPDVLLKLRLRE